MPSKRMTERGAVAEYEDFVLGALAPSSIDTFLSLRPRLPRYVRVRQCVVYHRGDLVSALAGKFIWSGRRLELVNPAGAVFQVSLSRRNGEERDTTGYMAVLPGSRVDCHRIVTVSFTRFWVSVVRPVVRRLYPDAMPMFFKQGEIRDALLSLERSLGPEYELRITEATMKTMRPDRRSAAARLDTDRRWTELAIDQAFDDALEQRQWFTSVHFKVRRLSDGGGHRDVAIACVYKRGEITYDGLHQEISAHLTSVLEKYGTERLELLRARGIRERNYSPSPPIEIRYQHDVFGDVSQVRRFARAIARYPNSTKAVLHGNPYYHASIADYVDGSSFEVWILSPARVLIVPQAKSTEQAFERLIAHVFSEFREGAIGEYSG